MGHRRHDGRLAGRRAARRARGAPARPLVPPRPDQPAAELPAGLREFAATATQGRVHVTRSLELAEQALALGPDLAEVHAARAYLLLNITWDWPAARAAFERALELDPANPIMLRRYADLHDLAGDLDGEERLLRRAIALDP